MKYAILHEASGKFYDPSLVINGHIQFDYGATCWPKREAKAILKGLNMPDLVLCAFKREKFCKGHYHLAYVGPVKD